MRIIEYQRHDGFTPQTTCSLGIVFFSDTCFHKMQTRFSVMILLIIGIYSIKPTQFLVLDFKMLIVNTCIFLALGVIASTKPISSPVVHERRDSTPSGFTMKGPANNSTRLSLRIALTSNNLDGLEAAVYKNAYRGNGVFKDHLTKEEVS